MAGWDSRGLALPLLAVLKFFLFFGGIFPRITPLKVEAAPRGCGFKIEPGVLGRHKTRRAGGGLASFCDNASMSLRFTRRRWVVLIGSAAPVVALAEQAPATPPPQTPQQKMEKAKARVRQVTEKLAGITVPMGTEPSFRFSAV